MTSQTDGSMATAYKDIDKCLEARGHKSQLNITDNECSKAVRKYMRTTNVAWQQVDPNNHGVNAAERAIRTFKNSFLAGLSTVNIHFPIQLWCYLLIQAKLTLHLFHTLQLNPTISAYEQLEGAFNYNRTSLAPPGTKALIFKPPTRQAAWAPHPLTVDTSVQP